MPCRGINDGRAPARRVAGTDRGRVPLLHAAVAHHPCSDDRAKELNTSTTTATWLVTSLLVASAVSTPITGRLGDMFGRSRMLVFTLGLMCVGTVISALAGSIAVLLVGRVVQGAAGGVAALTFSVVRDVVPPHKVAGGVGLISGVMSIGAMTGIIFSGPIVTTLGYRYLFWLPLIAMVPVTIAAAFTIPPSAPVKGARVDWLGAVLLAAWLMCLLIAVSQGPHWGWASARVLGLLGAASTGLAVWVAFERRQADPLVDIGLLRRPSIWRANVATFASGMAMQSTFTFVPRLAQMPKSTGYGLGVRSSRGGLVTVLWSFGSTIAGFSAGRLVRRFGARFVLAIGATIATAGYVLVLFSHANVFLLAIWLGIFGFGVGYVIAVIPIVLLDNVTANETGVVNGMNQNVRTIGGAVGTQVVATILSTGLRADGFPREAMYKVSFVVLLGACLTMVVAALLLPRSR